jgi:hypothetical protein
VGAVLRRPPPALLVVTTAGALLSLTACSGLGNAETDNARRAAQRFMEAVTDDPGAACALLAPGTLEELEESEGACDAALPGQDLGSATGPATVEVYGKDAVAHLGDATLFLARFDDGWRVTAAGCAPVPARPYDCTVKGD